MKVPPARVVPPLSWVEDPVNPLTLQGVLHPGPEKYATAVAGVKPVPVIIKVKDWLAAGAAGVVEMLET